MDRGRSPHFSIEGRTDTVKQAYRNHATIGNRGPVLKEDETALPCFCIRNSKGAIVAETELPVLGKIAV
jgi:hypothetical protein